MVFDPVCGMEIPWRAAQFASTYNGEKHYFCSENCKAHFDADPERYTGHV